MITVEEALETINQHLPKKLLNFGLTTESLIADRDYPPFDRATMDGIAVSFNSYQEGRREFKILGVCAAGVEQVVLNHPNACFEIMTGAALPVHADLIIPYEEIKIENEIAFVVKEASRVKSQFIHLKGSDALQGKNLLPAGSFLNGPAVGIAASVGKSLNQKNNHDQDQIRIQIISTGDELVDVDQTPKNYQLRKSNVFALEKSLRLFGFTNIKLTHLNDEPEAIETHYLQNHREFDLLIYSGGVSKGKFDYLPKCWEKLGVTEHFHRVSQRPGKPLWFGTDSKSGTAVLGLPGNPVSSLVCLHRYFLSRKVIYAQLAEDISFPIDLTLFAPVRIESTTDGILKAYPLKIKNSGEFTALAGSDGFIELPKEKSSFKAGEAFRFFSWNCS